MNLQQGAAVACSLSLSLPPALSLCPCTTAAVKGPRASRFWPLVAGVQTVSTFPQRKFVKNVEQTKIFQLVSVICYLLSTWVHCRPLKADDMKIISSALAPPLSVSVCLSDANAECAHSGIEKMCNLRCLAGGVAAEGKEGELTTLSSNLRELLEQLNCLPRAQVFISLQTAR